MSTFDLGGTKPNTRMIGKYLIEIGKLKEIVI